MTVGDGLGSDLLTDLVLEWRQARKDSEGGGSYPNLVGEDPKDQGVEDYVVLPRLSPPGILCQGCDLSRLSSCSFRREVAQTSGTRHRMAAGLRSRESPEGDVDASPPIVSHRVVGCVEVALVIVLPEAACGLHSALRQGAVDCSVDVVPTLL